MQLVVRHSLIQIRYMSLPNENKLIMSECRREFEELLRSTGRENIEYVIEDIAELGFFEAPASTKFHLNEEGGLCQHSLNVCRIALRLREQMIDMMPDMEERLSRDSVIIASLLHDVCKSDIYKPTILKKKNDLGTWEAVPGYTVDYNNFPVGHGEKSVIVILRCGFDLTNDEILAIRWHMTAWDLPFQSADIKSNLNTARENCPLLCLIQSADSLAAGIIEIKS